MKTTLFIRDVSSQTGISVYLATALLLANCGKSQDPSASSLVGVRAVLEGQAETGYIPDPNASGSGSDGGYYLPPNPDSFTSTSTDTQSSPPDSTSPTSETQTADTNTNTSTNPDSITSTDGSVSAPDPTTTLSEPTADSGGTDGGTVLPPGETMGGSDGGTVTQNDNTTGGDGGSTETGTNTGTVDSTDSSGGVADGGTDSSTDSNSPSGSDGGTVIGDNGTPIGDTDGGSVNDGGSSSAGSDGGTSPGTDGSEYTDPAYCVTASDWVRFKLNAVGGKSDALAFADAQNPILAVEARAPSEAALKNPMSQYKNGNSAVGPEYYEYLRQQPAVLLRTVDLKRVDYFGPKFRGALELDYSTLRWNAAASQLPQGWKKVLVTFYVCDDTNQDGKCSTEEFGDQVLLNPPTFKACQLPSAVVAPAR